MVSPLASVLARIFMNFHESKWLNEYNLNKAKFYLRYVDDILAVFDNEQDSLNFFLSFEIIGILRLNSLEKNKLTIPLVFFMYSFQVPIIKISHFRHIPNQPLQDFS